MKKIRLIVLLVVFVLLLSACNKDDSSKDKKEEMITAVETVRAVKDDLIVERKLYGRTAAKSISPVMLEIPGEVDTTEVSTGDQVEKDDTILTLKTPMGKQTIKAPQSGEVINFTASEGDVVSETDPIAMIADLDQMIISSSVTTKIRSLLKKEDKISAVIEDEEFEAEVAVIDKMPDDTGLYPIELHVENKEEVILPGMIAALSIPESRIKDSIILPTAAIVEDSDGTFVYVVKDDHVERVPVDVQVTQTTQTAIEGEIDLDDEIVINGQLTLTDGSKVNVVKEGE